MVDRANALLADRTIGDPAVAAELLRMLPELDELGQRDAAVQIANLSDDELAGKWINLLADGQLPTPTVDAFFQNLKIRPQYLMLPALAKMADSPAHPKGRDSIEILRTLFGNPPPGTTWLSLVEARTGLLIGPEETRTLMRSRK